MNVEVSSLRVHRGLSRWDRFKIRLQLLSRRGREAWSVFARNRLALLGLVLILIFGLMAIAHPILIDTVWPSGIYDPETGYDLEIFPHPSPPSARHWLGTDSLGRDVLSMLLASATPTFVLGFTAAITTAFIGTLIGAVAAYYGGRVDSVLMHIADAFLLLPAPIAMIVVGVALRHWDAARLGALYGAIAGLGGTAVVLRSQALTVMAKPCIVAARVAGGGVGHIIARHLIPHLIPLAATLMMITVTGAVVADAFVSFFGLTRLYLNWGTMIYLSQAYSGALQTGIEWHVLLPPSLAISLFAAAFYLVGRGLNEVADPHQRRDR